MKHALLVLTFALLSSCVYSQIVEEDVLYFKDGNIKRGVITGISGDRAITMLTDLGTLRSYPLAQIDSIAKNNRAALEAGVRMAESQTLRGVFSIAGAFQYLSVKTREIFPNGNTGTSKLADYEYSILSVSPSIGYFMFDNFSFNFAIDYEKHESDYGSAEYAVYAIYMEYYFGPQASKPFISAGFLFLSENVEEINSAFFAGAGYNIAIAKNVSLQPLLRYRYYYPEDKKAGDINSISFGIGIRTFIF